MLHSIKQGELVASCEAACCFSNDYSHKAHYGYPDSLLPLSILPEVAAQRPDGVGPTLQVHNYSVNEKPNVER